MAFSFLASWTPFDVRFRCPRKRVKPAVGVVRRLNPSFADIERAAGIEQLRPYYQLASHQIHSNPKGVYFKMGLMDEVDVLLAGPSDFGLADTGQSTAISLSQVTVSLVTSAPTLDGIVGAKILAKLTPEVCDLFVKLQSEYALPCEY